MLMKGKVEVTTVVYTFSTSGLWTRSGEPAQGRHKLASEVSKVLILGNTEVMYFTHYSEKKEKKRKATKMKK